MGGVIVKRSKFDRELEDCLKWIDKMLSPQINDLLKWFKNSFNPICERYGGTKQDEQKRQQNKG